MPQCQYSHDTQTRVRLEDTYSRSALSEVGKPVYTYGWPSLMLGVCPAIPLCNLDSLMPDVHVETKADPGWLPRVVFGIALCCFSFTMAESSQGETNATEELGIEELKLQGKKHSKYLSQAPAPRADESQKLHPNVDEFKRTIQPILAQACVQCHGPENEEGNIRIDILDPDLVEGKDVEWWLEVQAVLSNGEMPPPQDGDPDAPKLSDTDRSRIVEWLSNEIQVASKLRRESGQHSSFRRMTRYEYNYAMQDILGQPWDFAKDLPPEAHSEDGFQNSSEMLHMSVMQFDTYRELASKALRRVTVTGDRPPVVRWGITMKQMADKEITRQEKQLNDIRERHKDDPEKQKAEVEKRIAANGKTNGKPYYRDRSTGESVKASWTHHHSPYAFMANDAAAEFPESMDYVAVIPQGRNQEMTVELSDELPDEGTMRVRVRAWRKSDAKDRVPSMQLRFGFRASNEGRANMRVSKADILVKATQDDPQIYQWDIPLGEIYPRNSERGVSKMFGSPSPSEFIRLVNSSVDLPGKIQSDIELDYVEVAAPVYEQWPPQSHRNIFFESENRDDESVYAREVLTAFMSRAWRQKVTRADVNQKLSLFKTMRPECESLEEAMVEVLAVVLASPNFLYVACEGADADVLSQRELATRLSMFLWSSVPDQTLLDLADSGKLTNPSVLSAQVDRLLADARSKRFSKHFVRQWLDMQLLDFMKVDPKKPEFDTALKEAMHGEPIEFFHDALQRNESVLNFIHADYTLANERLARHYGLNNVDGNHFRRVLLGQNAQRGGLLTTAGLLAMNSDGVDSHPLKRGVWLLESILNDPPPPPPPAVPEIDLADPEIAKMTLKERIEDHRNHAACMSCHAKIDPWGIAFENYDALGRWRDKVGDKPVDATSQLFNKEKLNGMNGLKRYLLQNRQDQFVRAMVHKMTTYALGRPLVFSDRASVEQVTTAVRKNDDALADMVRSIVTSDLFRSK